MLRVPGRRWAIEEEFQAGKGQAGLDEHQVLGWVSWRRWTVLTMLAHAFTAAGPTRMLSSGSALTVTCSAVVLCCGEQFQIETPERICADPADAAHLIERRSRDHRPQAPRS